MADEEDLLRLRQREQDMARCDLRGADLSGWDLSGRDFTGAHFEAANISLSSCQDSTFTGAKLTNLNAKGAIMMDMTAPGTVFFRVNFQDAVLRYSNFSRSHFSGTNFNSADLRGADLRNAVINEGTTFENCATDEGTMFDGAQIFRPLARLPAFRYYRVERGALVRNTGDPEPEQRPHRPAAQGINSAAPVVVGVIEQRISEHPQDLAAMALILSISVAEQIEELERSRPNEPTALDAHQRYTDFLRQLAEGLRRIGETIAAIQSADDLATRKEELSRAAQVVQHVSSALDEWLAQNAKMVIDFGFRTGLLCAGTKLLSLCGVPAWGAFVPLATLLSGQSLVDGIKLWKGGRSGPEGSDK